MATIGKIVLRVVFVLCLLLVLIGDMTGLLGRMTGSGEQDWPPTRPPRPTNPGYGDPRVDIYLDADIEDEALQNTEPSRSRRSFPSAAVMSACLGMTVCMIATKANHLHRAEERRLLDVIHATTINSVAEVASKYHFAAHMGQLIAGVDGNGCHHFYPTCPFPGIQGFRMKKLRMR